MFDFGCALSRCGRLCLVVVFYWLHGQDFSFVNSHRVNGSRPTTKFPWNRTTKNSTLSSTTLKNYLSTSPSTRQPSIMTTSYRKSKELEDSDIQPNMTIIVSSCLVAFIILVIVGAILIVKIFQRRKKDKIASAIESDQQQQHRVDSNNLTQSSNSTGSEPEVNCCYENIVAEPTAPDLEAIISPVYATEEYLPRYYSVIVEDYATTFHSVEFLDCDQPIMYADLKFKE